MMALPQIISRNVAQKLAGISITARVVLQPHTWYTCPTGKKARVKGTVQCTGFGASANTSFNVSGVEMYRWNGTGATKNYLESPRDLQVVDGGQMALFDIELAAGDIVETTQNTGTNAEFNVWADVEETPI